MSIALNLELSSITSALQMQISNLLRDTMHSDVHFCFSLLSFSPLSASLSFVVARCGPSFAHFCFFRRRLAIQSFTSPSCRRCRLLSPFVVLSSASHSLTSASHSQCRLVFVLRVPQESYNSGYRPARYVTKFLLAALKL